MRVTISTNLATSAERAWAEVQTSRLLDYVARPMLSFKPVDPSLWPEIWQEDKYLVRMYAFGVIWFGEQWIVITKPLLGPDRYQLRDNGHGKLISRWDHLITIERLDSRTCRYTDKIDVEAGILTPLVWSFALAFYAHRQRRWRKLVKSGFSY